MDVALRHGRAEWRAVSGVEQRDYGGRIELNVEPLHAALEHLVANDRELFFLDRDLWRLAIGVLDMDGAGALPLGAGDVGFFVICHDWSLCEDEFTGLQRADPIDIRGRVVSTGHSQTLVRVVGGKRRRCPASSRSSNSSQGAGGHRHGACVKAHIARTVIGQRACRIGNRHDHTVVARSTRL